MKASSDRTLFSVATLVGALALIGFAFGVMQTLKGPAEGARLPLPTPQASLMNLDAVPRAAPLDAAAMNALQGAAPKASAKKDEDDEDEEDGQDQGASEKAQAASAPAVPAPAATAAPREGAPREGAVSPPPGNSQHGPF